MKRDGDDFQRDILASGTGGKRSYLSQQHLWSAELFAKKAEELEGGTAQPDPPLRPNRDHRAFVIGSVLSSVAYLEGAINELFEDSVDGGDGQRQLETDTVTRLARVWGVVNERARMLDKYELALFAAGKAPLDRAVATFGNAKGVVILRNALVHYSPEWHYFGEAGPQTLKERHRLEKTLGGKFTQNPLADPGLPFFPDKCLGGGCARWSIESCKAFYDDFRERMGLPPDRASELLEWP